MENVKVFEDWPPTKAQIENALKETEKRSEIERKKYVVVKKKYDECTETTRPPSCDWHTLRKYEDEFNRAKARLRIAQLAKYFSDLKIGDAMTLIGNRKYGWRPIIAKLTESQNKGYWTSEPYMDIFEVEVEEKRKDGTIIVKNKSGSGKLIGKTTTEDDGMTFLILRTRA